jgi:hypothetical protein
VSRFNLASLLALIGVLALGLAAMRDGSDLVERIIFTLLLVVLFAGLVGAIVRRRAGAWAGFAVCGWGYSFIAFIPAVNEEVAPHLLTMKPLNDFVARLYPQETPPALPTLNSNFMQTVGDVVDLQLAMKNNLSRALLSPTEQQALDSYSGNLQTYLTRRDSIEQRVANALRIGHSMLALAFALVGAVLGRVLGARRGSGVGDGPLNSAGLARPTPDQ